MKLKKCMALGLAAVMTASFVLGCGGGSGDETQAPAGDGASAASDASGDASADGGSGDLSEYFTIH